MSRLRLDDAHLNRRGDVVSTPVYTLGAAVAFVGAAVVLVVTGNADTGNGAVLLTLLIANIPGLISSLFAERVSRDVRNGVVADKAREGARKALDETGVTKAVAEGEQTTPAALDALSRLLDRLDGLHITQDNETRKGSGQHDG